MAGGKWGSGDLPVPLHQLTDTHSHQRAGVPQGQAHPDSSPSPPDYPTVGSSTPA